MVLVPPHQTLLPSSLTKLAINFSGAGDNVIIAAASGQIVRVYRLKILCAGATAISIEDSAGTVMDGPLPFAGNQGMLLDLSSEPWYITPRGLGFSIKSSNPVQVGGNVEYLQS